MSSQREAKAKTEFKECTFKPQREESTDSLAKVRATVKKSNKKGTAKAQKRESSINQFVEVTPLICCLSAPHMHVWSVLTRHLL